LNTFDEGRSGHPDRHGFRVMAVDAGYRVGMAARVQFRAQILIRESIRCLEPGHGIAVSDLPVQRHHRSMTMEARPRLRFGEPLRMLLILEHVRMPAAVAVVERKGVAEKHPLEPRIALDLLLWQRFAATMSSEASMRGFGRPA